MSFPYSEKEADVALIPDEKPAKRRLASLDILRGFDLFLLLFLQPVVVAVLSRIPSEWSSSLLYQLEHAEWVGFRFWDLIMPLFLFMTGVAMPFSFSKLVGQPKGQVYAKILRRVLLLFLCGMIVQGNVLALGQAHLVIYSNTLQSIAVGYLITAVLMIHCHVRGQLIVLATLLVVYTLPMQWGGDFSLEGNFAAQVDRYVLGRFQGDPSYTWVWSSLTFACTVLTGALAGQAIRFWRDRPGIVIRTLTVSGVAMIGIALLLSPLHPIIKRVWSSTMTLYSGGICLLLMALFYYVIDVRGWSRGLNWLKVYGTNSITAYMLGMVVNFRSIPTSLTYGLQPYLGEFYPAWLTFANSLIIFLILLWMDKHKIFLKL